MLRTLCILMVAFLAAPLAVAGATTDYLYEGAPAGHLRDHEGEWAKGIGDDPIGEASKAADPQYVPDKANHTIAVACWGAAYYGSMMANESDIPCTPYHEADPADGFDLLDLGDAAITDGLHALDVTLDAVNRTIQKIEGKYDEVRATVLFVIGLIFG